LVILTDPALMKISALDAWLRQQCAYFRRWCIGLASCRTVWGCNMQKTRV